MTLDTRKKKGNAVYSLQSTTDDMASVSEVAYSAHKNEDLDVLQAVLEQLQSEEELETVISEGEAREILFSIQGKGGAGRNSSDVNKAKKIQKL